MESKNQILLICLLGIFLITLASARLGTYDVNDCVNIKVLSNCTQVNLTFIETNQETFVIDSPMQHLGGQTFNYTFCNTSYKAQYRYAWTESCVDCSGGLCGNDFMVNPTGVSLDESKSTMYMFILVISLLLFFGLMTIGIFLPVSNKKDQMTGYILQVNNLKYLKIVCIGFAYLVALVIMYLSWMITYSYLDMIFLSNIFRFIFTFMAILVLPFFILLVYILIANLVRDSKVKDALMRGLRIRE